MWPESRQENHEQISGILKENTGVFQTLVQRIGHRQSCWRPAEGKWSVLEVINHLYDEEREVFDKIMVELKKKGKNYTGLCPWHDDTNPSLSVDRQGGLG